MQKILFLFVLLLAGYFSAKGQGVWRKQGYRPVVPVCYASEEVNKIYIPPPTEVLDMLKSAEKKSVIEVSYSQFPPDAKVAFERAVDIWERLIESPVPIHIQANWRPPSPDSENSLGWCSPTDFKKNFKGAPRKDIYYPIALVEKLSGSELTGASQPDMEAVFNKEINWYFGTDGDTPVLLYDFVSVVLHEIGHGLGFTGFFVLEDDPNQGAYGFTNIFGDVVEYGPFSSFDNLVVKNDSRLVDTSVYSNPSTKLGNEFTSNQLYANSPVAITDGEGLKPRLYAPLKWNEGSSIYHLNDATYPSGDDALMTHALGRGEAIHDPGSIAMGILADIGWKNMQIEFDPMKDQEEVGPLRVEVKITSDYELDTTQLFIVFSEDSFDSQPDSLPLLDDGTGLFVAEWLPDQETTVIDYYISAGDVKNRIFRNPSEAPGEFYEVNFGPDNAPPVIEHEPVPYFFDTGNALFIVAHIDDNLGVDTAFVEYSINGIAQAPFGLSNDSATVYSAAFPVDNTLLNDGDEIAYYIVATDASIAQNTRQIPEGNAFTFKVEKMLDPIAGYINHFDNTGTTDFILTDFNVATAPGFQNGALHSPHPYPSPDQEDTEFHFSTLLKYPIVLTGKAIMNFDEIVLVEPGELGTSFGDFEFWDYVIVEGSKNKGKTWLPLIDGYDSGANTTWEAKYNEKIIDGNSTTIGSSGLYVSRDINMLENGNFSAGDTIIIRFRLFSDPFAHGWGWAIDNLRIQTPVSTPLPVLSPGNIMAYPNPFSGSFTVFAEPKSAIDELQLDVFNMYGQKVKSVLHRNVTGQLASEIEIENSVSGVYFLVVKENGRQVFTKKLICN